MEITFGIDGKIYLTGFIQSPFQHLPTQTSICLQDEIEKVIRRLLDERIPPPPQEKR